jgi:hypothetical protein
MTVTHDEMCSASDRTQAMVEELNGLLVRQIASAREGNLAQVEQLATRANALVAGIVQGPSSVSSDVQSKKAQLKGLYDELTLALRAERGEAQAKLKQLRQVKRAVGAYGRKTGR